VNIAVMTRQHRFHMKDDDDNDGRITVLGMVDLEARYMLKFRSKKLRPVVEFADKEMWVNRWNDRSVDARWKPLLVRFRLETLG
jgi:hypothetical protein